jgi:hypothetical protein
MDWRGATPEGEQSGEALFLMRLLRWVRGAFWISIAAMVPGVVQAYRDQDLARPVVVLMLLYLFVVIPVTGIAMRAAARGDVSRASLLASLLMWGPALVIAILVPPLAVVALLAALVPTVFAIPYASRRTHLQIILISAVVASISATIGAVGFEVIPSRIDAAYNSFGFFVPVGIVAAFLTVAA